MKQKLFALIILFSLTAYSQEDVLIHIDSPEKFDSTRKTILIYYALPNGNSTAWTIGKKIEEGDDWHFDIQHIGAQTKFLREKINQYNYVTIYLETSQKSWPAWKAAHADYAARVKSVSDSLINLFRKYDPVVVLSGHSGGGRFIFSFLDAYEKIPSFIKRICFLDSNYGYEKIYSDKITEWLKSSEDNYLCVLAYNDSTVTFNGKPVVSPTGGTWYRSRIMQKEMSANFSFISSEDTSFIIHKALNGRINFTLKKNPSNEILHTVQVERNGFIHSILNGTEFENRGYWYFGERAYVVE